MDGRGSIGDGRVSVGDPVVGSDSDGDPLDGTGSVGDPMDGRGSVGHPMDGRASVGHPMGSVGEDGSASLGVLLCLFAIGDPLDIGGLCSTGTRDATGSAGGILLVGHALDKGSVLLLISGSLVERVKIRDCFGSRRDDDFIADGPKQFWEGSHTNAGSSSQSASLDSMASNRSTSSSSSIVSKQIGEGRMGVVGSQHNTLQCNNDLPVIGSSTSSQFVCFDLFLCFRNFFSFL